VDIPLWWPRNQWPSQRTELPLTEVENRAVKAHVASMPTEDFLDRFSEVDRALRVLAYVHRFPITAFRGPSRGAGCAAAERLMTICTQRGYFFEEYRCLSQKRPVPAASSVLSLNPFLDQKADGEEESLETNVGE